MDQFKQPMLARDYDPAALLFPVWASPKIDGYRCGVFNAKAKTRSGKDFRNEYVQKMIGDGAINGLDGELIVGAPNAPDVYNRSSAVMAKSGEPDFTYIVFDDASRPELNYETRLSIAANKVARFGSARVSMLPQRFIQSVEELEAYEAEQIALGYEGIMLRRPGTPYKHGRSTVSEGYLMKVKRYSHEEAKIIGYEELMHNANEAFKDELGKTKRSETQDGLYPSGMIGSYIVENPKYAKSFKISCGSMDHKERKARLESIDEDNGKTVRYKFLPHGTKDVPRHGLYAGFRDLDDLQDVVPVK